MCFFRLKSKETFCYNSCLETRSLLKLVSNSTPYVYDNIDELYSEITYDTQNHPKDSFKPFLKPSASMLNVRSSNLVNEDNDVILDWCNGVVIQQLSVKRTGEFLSLKDTYGNNVTINLFELFEEKFRTKNKKKKGFFARYF